MHAVGRERDALHLADGDPARVDFIAHAQAVDGIEHHVQIRVLPEQHFLAEHGGQRKQHGNDGKRKNADDHFNHNLFFELHFPNAFRTSCKSAMPCACRKSRTTGCFDAMNSSGVAQTTMRPSWSMATRVPI